MIDGNEVGEKRCRIIMDVNIRIIKITPGSVRDHFIPDETGKGLSWEWAERQNRLLLALLQDEESLDELLIGITRDELEMRLEIGSRQYRSDDELFERVYSEMGRGDALYFQEAKDEGLLDENLELVDKAFIIDWKHAEIEDICVIKLDEDQTIKD